ncbi:phycobilisome linker polypeptide [Cyanobacteria bacterium FACHB-DQ100]|nr:phycobilisome linker polypeptide [Cyanobacteria bacterium FACHB-DQ100]
MLGQTAVGSAATTQSGARMFRYEVVGLRQNDQTDRNNYQIRNSGSVFLTVPYNRMTEEMQRIARLGGRIVSITPLTQVDTSANQE